MNDDGFALVGKLLLTAGALAPTIWGTVEALGRMFPRWVKGEVKALGALALGVAISLVVLGMDLFPGLDRSYAVSWVVAALVGVVSTVGAWKGNDLVYNPIRARLGSVKGGE